ncbi:MAG: hypothetical protein ACD_36C00098G0003 [uncultured bacterium]|uniref:Uncharacterized protein n=1 Tax=Candidatus Gottesmanbacteria bacterium RIFCSPLOWO2_01_FULL_43_11b TaxID=1798392 RepID=A0A1F6AGK3_9BACT|nr:MAG: hypothetical protein ACD_36C00098G0003 [uncultured bacterium]OGG23888.1 MAG: hypothetical protein A3A79_01665 [Candidatus Gottesmanbacteria bacterium RIFCSPLOWO2_01_FULL_43_11b]
MPKVDVMTEFPGSQEPPEPIKVPKQKPVPLDKQMQDLIEAEKALHREQVATHIPPRRRLTRTSAELPQT